MALRQTSLKGIQLNLTRVPENSGMKRNLILRVVQGGRTRNELSGPHLYLKTSRNESRTCQIKWE